MFGGALGTGTKYVSARRGILERHLAKSGTGLGVHELANPRDIAPISRRPCREAARRIRRERFGLAMELAPDCGLQLGEPAC